MKALPAGAHPKRKPANLWGLGLRVAEDSMTDLFELLDVDGSGRLTRGEFVEGLLNLVLMDVAGLRFLGVGFGGGGVRV